MHLKAHNVRQGHAGDHAIRVDSLAVSTSQPKVLVVVNFILLQVDTCFDVNILSWLVLMLTVN